MLSRNCDGCSQFRACNKRYGKVAKGGLVYCPNGTAHLVDEDSLCQCEDLYLKNLEMFQ
jgi:hypothetical protein